MCRYSWVIMSWRVSSPADVVAGIILFSLTDCPLLTVFAVGQVHESEDVQEDSSSESLHSSAVSLCLAIPWCL